MADQRTRLLDATPEGLAAAFGRFVTRAVGPDRDVTLARYALQLETAREPSLRAFYAVGADTVDRHPRLGRR